VRGFLLVFCRVGCACPVYILTDWGIRSAFPHRRSISGVIILLAAAPPSSTKHKVPEKLSPFFHPLKPKLSPPPMAARCFSISVPSSSKTLVSSNPIPHPHENPRQNRGTIHIMAIKCPSPDPSRCGHIDIRYFALLQWVEGGHIIFVPVPTDLNVSDSLTKATGCIKFHQHVDIYMGRIPPPYAANGRTIRITPKSSLFLLHTIIPSLPCLTMIDAVYSMGRCSDTILQ
jgi:hypothetical protein